MTSKNFWSRPHDSSAYRSGLEDVLSEQLKALGVSFQYEPFWIKYIKPEKVAKYKPDFVLPNGIIIETKGRFVTEDRTKMRLVKEQYPDLDIRFVFSNPQERISKKSKTTYAMWCEKLEFPYSKVSIPQSWLDEPPIPERLEALKQFYE